MKTTLIIARHGNTFSPGDVVTRVGARTDMPLSPSGLEQATKLGLYLREYNLLPDIVFTSSLRRTKQTAAQALATADVQCMASAISLFDEIDYGVDENKPEAEVVARVGEAALKAWDEDAIVPKGWNVDVEGIVRGWKAFGDEMLRGFGGKKILVVTSNGIARFAPHLTGDFEGFRQSHKLKLSTGALAVLAHNRAWTVEVWNVKP
ncbi:MAG: histidine phosphatase family protein [Alphaproteobacteria bacterium]|nr:histidine phosphatase family protein [Alphaproteobacteria bacterium]